MAEPETLTEQMERLLGGSPTGRLPREPEMQDIRRHISDPSVIIVEKDMDFAEIEMRVLAALTGNGAAILIDLPSCGGEIPGLASLFDIPAELLHGAPRRYFVLKTEIPAPEPRPRKAAPAYLKHDPTKNHRRPR